MPRIELVEPYAVRLARQSIRDSLMSHGEECILLHMYHVNEVDGIVPRCPNCYDDVYEQGSEYNCPQCYGTTFDGGVKDVYRAWAIFTDAQDSENLTDKGIWHPRDASVHTEHIPDLWQRDFVVRVNQWSLDHRPLSIEGVYVFKQVTNETLRTGNRHGQTWFDNIGQRADVQWISTSMPIYNYPFVGQVFNRYDGKPR